MQGEFISSVAIKKFGDPRTSPAKRVVWGACDYIAGMTDKYAVECYSNAFIPMAWSVK